MEALQVIIMAGGKGTRIRSIVSDVPKPMIPIAGKPLLERQIEFFVRNGVHEITITIGYLGHIIKEYFGNGERFGVKIRYIEETSPLGTAGALRYSAPGPELLLVVNGDILFDFDLERMVTYHRERHSDITLFTHPNQHPYDSAIIIADFDGRIVQWLNKEDPREDVPNRVNAGIHLIQREALDFGNPVWDKKIVDLDREILKPNIHRQKMFAYDSPEYVKDMGTPERLRQVEKDLLAGIVAAKNLRKKQKAVFLDRDGTINRYVGYVSNSEQLELLDGAAEAIRRINRSPYLAIVVSNQPVIARGECSFDGMRKIHNRLEMLLGNEGAYLDAIDFCPHHPDSGFPGEVKELKFDCACRKPKPGMLMRMAERYNIDLSASWMIGDSWRDVKAGISAGCRTIYIGNDNAEDAKYKVQSVLVGINHVLVADD